jgi:hypothetical protein
MMVVQAWYDSRVGGGIDQFRDTTQKNTANPGMASAYSRKPLALVWVRCGSGKSLFS